MAALRRSTRNAGKKETNSVEPAALPSPAPKRQRKATAGAKSTAGAKGKGKAAAPATVNVGKSTTAVAKTVAAAAPTSPKKQHDKIAKSAYDRVVRDVKQVDRDAVLHKVLGPRERYAKKIAGKMDARKAKLRDIVNAEFRRLSGVADAIATPSRYETVGSELARLSNLPEAARAEIHSSTDHEVRRLSSLPNAAAHRVAEHVDHELARLSGLPRASVTPVGSQAESFVTETQRLGGLAELFVDRKPAVKPAAILAKVRAENARRIAGAKIVGKAVVSEIKQLGKSSGVTTLLRKPAPMALTTIAKPAGTTIAPQQLQKRALGELKMVVSPGATVVRPSVVKDKLGVVQTMQAVQQEALKSVAMREIRAKF